MLIENNLFLFKNIFVMKKIFIINLILIIFLTGCIDRKKDKIEDYEAKSYIHSMLSSIYYWSDEIPVGVSMLDHNLYDYFDNSLYSGDRWSWMCDIEQWNNSETGIYTSYGASLSQPVEYFNDYSIKIRFVHPNTPFDKAGITRGWTLTHINDTPVMTLVEKDKFSEEYAKSPNKFTFIDLNGNTKTFTMSSEVVTTKSYLRKVIFTSDDYPGLSSAVGYFNYLSFNANMLDDITSAFEEFHSAGIKDLILDLRYNGGGNEKATSLLANYIAPLSADGEILAKRKHNSNFSKYDEEGILKISRKTSALSLDHLIIIAGEGSASASEVIINGMKPFFGKGSIIQVGDTTYGKPNGMYVFPFPEGPDNDYYGSAEYIFLPICFFSSNKLGEQISVNGIIPDQYRPDDLYHDWGVNEDLIGSSLYYLVNGTFPKLPAKKQYTKSFEAGSVKIKTEEDSPYYGRDVVIPDFRLK